MHHHFAAGPDQSDASGHEPGHAAHSTVGGAALHHTGASPTISIKISCRPFISECWENGEMFLCLKRILTAQFDPRFKCQSAEGSAPLCVKEPGKKNRDEHQAAQARPALAANGSSQPFLSDPALCVPRNPLQGGGHRAPPSRRTARASDWDADR